MNRCVPTTRQMEYQSWEMGLFIHFGIRTFYQGWIDMDERPMSPELFCPSELDCNQWAKTAKQAGFQYIVMTAKHHDGFALWPSATTDFSVASSPWKDGNGDVVREFIDACRAHDLAVGLYYSPFDSNAPVYDDETAYDDYFVTQISEILEPYGQIDILWFDGCGSESHQYDWERIVGEIRRMQPNLMLFNMGDPDFRWIGNEQGYAPLGTRNVVDRIPLSIHATDGDRVEPTWLPAECDARVRSWNWFFSDEDEHTVKSVDELVGMWYYSVGRGCNLLLNIGPDRRGLLPDKDAKTITDLGEEVRERFTAPLATIGECIRDGNRWIWKPESTTLIDHVVIAEKIEAGERIADFTIQVAAETTITVFQGETVGARQVCRFPPICANEIWIETSGDVGIELAQLDFHMVGA
jgi:alpha-L-fucosidase